jgi:hypothetical protein
VPDYLIASDMHAPEPRMLYGLACDGPFAALARFDATNEIGAIELADLADTCLEMTGASVAGLVLIAEAAGLVGAALRRSPVDAVPDGDFFAHPDVRARLTFTAERAFAHTVTLAAGIVAKPGVAVDGAQLRPLGGPSGAVGHFHAAAFPFRPFRKGEIGLADTVKTLFEHQSVLGVLHLLHDDRGAAGAGQSEFMRGACWLAPISTWA